MVGNAIYYLGRVIKVGNLESRDVINAILEPKPIIRRGNCWSFFDAELHENNGVEFIYAKLSKYNPEGEVVIADIDTNKEVKRPEPNLRIASSPFVYIPSVSGIAFARVPNSIEENQFIRSFKDIIQLKYDSFFVECDIKFITDLRTFSEKLLSLDGIYSISANLRPPNPLFGPLWESLKEYIKERRSEKMIIREESNENKPLNTELPTHIQKMVEQTEDHPYEPDEKLPIGDEAILMSADGYGSGIIKGKKQHERIVIKTSETKKNFEYTKEPNPIELFEKAYEIFKRIERDRHMEH